ncbi:TonB-dependent receptor [Rhodocytophaga aerolata]|uniref:TonB-dependent receptor n=1 Tax=Rhodocytophaga aerolata TaxID=455078 RepID=A0ABT8RHD1_9BACT|nr:TonB-dependent receptor [Rhodocytophaga aerolata]MDO1450774.1 TonB-dependent receptor [Rhodocytophaga aerolata]
MKKKQLPILPSANRLFGIVSLTLAILLCNIQPGIAGSGQVHSIEEVIVSLELKNATIKQAFGEIESKTDFRFVYNSRKIDIAGRISMKAEGRTVAQVLNELFAHSPIAYKQVSRNIVLQPKEKTTAAALAMDEERAIVSGKVQDEQNGQPLPGASVVIGGTTLGTSTDLSGQFSFVAPLGEVTLEISYLGYRSKSMPFTVQPGTSNVLTIPLTSASFEIEGITVMGLLQGQSKALNQQKTADNIKNIVAAEQIGRFPDPNVAEALQRVPGVNIERDEGEGRYVLVRGLAPQFTNVSINGEQIPSPEAGIRYVALDAIPADQLSSIEVTKALTPDMDGDAIGGSVNLITRTAENTKLSVSGTLAGEYNNLMQKGGYQGALTISQRVGKEGKFGYMLNGSYYASQRGSDKNEMSDWDSPTDLYTFELRDYEIDRNRVGLSATFDYRFNANSQIYFRSIYSDLREHEWRRSLLFAYDEEDEVWTISRQTKDRPENQGVYSFNLGGTHTLPRLNLDYEVSLSRARQDTPYDRQTNFESDDVFFNNATNRLDVSNPLIPKIPALVDEDGQPFDYLNNASYVFDTYEASRTLATDRNLTAKINLGLPYSLAGNASTLKFGGKVRLKDKNYRLKEYNEWAYEGEQDLPISRFAGGLVDNNFQNGDYRIGSFADVPTFKSFFDANSSDFENDAQATAEERAAEEYTATENVYAAYLMSRTQFNKLMLLGGIRFEQTNVSYQSGQWDAEEEIAVPVSGTATYRYFLPMGHIKYSLTDHTNLRAAATFSYARPNFEDLVQGAEFNLGEREASIGNLALKPVSALNLDLFAEHYFGSVGILSGGIFYKRLDNFIYRRTNVQTFREVDNVELTQAVNGRTADLFGFEVAWQQNLTFLPGFLRGLGIYANYTYTSSEARLQNFTESDQQEITISLPGQSDHVGNVALSYMMGGFNGRISANFNGKFVSEISDGNLYSVNNRVQIDLSASQTLTPKLRIFLEAVNLTNQKRVDFDNSLATPRTREFYGFWTRLGVKFDF